MAEEDDDVEGLNTLMIVGSVLGLVTIPICITIRARVFNSRHDIRTEMVPILYERFLKLKAGLDFSLCLTILAGCLIRRSGLHPNAAPASALGAIYQLEEVSSLWLMYRMGVVPFRYLCKKEDASENDIYLRNTVLVALGLGLLFMIPPLAANLFGDNGLFFWFRDLYAEAYGFYWFALLISLECIINFVRVSRVSEHRRRRSLQHVRYGDYFTRMTVEITVVLFFDVLIWLLPYFLRSVSWWYAFAHGGRRTWSCRMLDTYSIGFRGAVDALVYVPKDGVVGVYRFLRRIGSRKKAKAADRRSDLETGDGDGAAPEHEADRVNLMLLGTTTPLPFFTDLPPPRLEERKMFVTTFNAGECTLESIINNIPDWIPKDLAVYVIGFQECLVLESLKEAILDHLGRDTYMCWDDAIGSTVTALGFHGFIGLIVVARIEDVRAGTFMIYESQRQRVARGKDLGVARAQNKGGVGLAFRYYDTAFGCISVHLASDSKGRTKLRKRLRDAGDLLCMTSLWKEAYKGFDLHHQHHVTIFLGDLNFRMKRACPRRVCMDLAYLCRREKEEHYAGRGDWRRLAYDAILQGARTGENGGWPADADAELSLGSSSPDVSYSEDPDVRHKDGSGGFGPSDDLQAATGGAWSKDEEEEEYYDDDEEDEQEEQLLEAAEEETDAAATEEEGSQSTAIPSVHNNTDTLTSRVSFHPFYRPPHPLSLTSSAATQSSIIRESWPDFMQADELQRSMVAGDILYGFVEGEIRFPPSYRRIRGPPGDCGDYTDPALMERAYSIWVKDKQSLKSLLKKKRSNVSASSASAAKASGISSSYSATTTGGPSMVSEVSQPHSSASGASSSPSERRSERSLRIPSYTDRILLFVQPDRRSRVVLEAYNACDAVTCSDHKPVASLITIKANTALAGLGSFLPMIRQRSDSQHPPLAPLLPPRPPSLGSAHRSYTVCSVQDAAFYKLEVVNVRVDFAEGVKRGLFPATAKPDHSMLQCPLAYEDAYRDLRRPAYVAQICRQMAFLTREARVNPFGYFNLKTWLHAEQGGFAIVTCLRPEWGMRAAIFIRSGRTELGSAILPLTDDAGVPLAQQKGVRVPTTRGGVHTGYLTCDIRLVQLAIPPREQKLFA